MFTALEMRRVGQARRRDGNEAAIISASEAIGVTTIPLSAAGVPDLLVWHPQHGFRLLEVKQARGRLTAAQTVMRTKLPFTVVHSVAEALSLYGVKS